MPIREIGTAAENMTSQERQIVLDSRSPAVDAVSVAGAPREISRSPDIAPAESSVPSAIYVGAYRAAVPRIRRLLSETSHLEDRLQFRRPRVDPRNLFRRLSTALAAGLIVEHDDEHAGDASLVDLVRTGLIHWQFSLLHDGRPAKLLSPRMEWHVAGTAQVAQLLGEASAFHEPMLLHDLDRHLHWLGRRPPMAPWVEAALIGALADGALVVRNTALLRMARHRADSLIGTQRKEGWFPERGGVDPARLSVTVDALSRLYLFHGWQQLAKPLTDAIRFLNALTPTAFAGTGPCRRLLSPAGVELLASSISNAASLAPYVRLRCAVWSRECFSSWSDDLFAMMIPRIVSASRAATADLSTGENEAGGGAPRRYYADAGIVVHSTNSYHAVVAARRGGALQITWQDPAIPLIDDGVVVVCPHSVRTGAKGKLRRRPIVNDHGVAIEAVLRSAGRAWLTSSQEGNGADSMTHAHPTPDFRVPHAGSIRRGHRLLAEYGRYAHDLCRRHVIFEDDAVRIRDEVYCRLPCQAVVCQSTGHGDANNWINNNGAYDTGREPIYVEGGRQVSIDRVYRNGVLVEVRTG